MTLCLLQVADLLDYPDRRQLGNDIPQTFEVHCPALQTRVKLSIPKYDLSSGEEYRIFTKDYIVSLCEKALKGSPSWKYLVEEPMRRGARLELCWRRGSMLDWIRWQSDVNGVNRGWAVLYGLCLAKVCLFSNKGYSPRAVELADTPQPRETTHLEVRIEEHRPTTVALEDGSHFREPPAVEGYIYRIKPNSQSHTQVYLSTHGGCLFSIHPSRAYPPRPPIPMTDDMMESGSYADDGSKRTGFEDSELLRGDIVAKLCSL
jgi:hypothetical protein